MTKSITITSEELEPYSPEGIYKEIKERFLKDREGILREFGTIDHSRMNEVEKSIRTQEVALASELIKRLVEVEKQKIVITYPFQQGADECVATSLVNGMVYLGEPFFTSSERAEQRKNEFVKYFLAHTRYDGKSSTRSLDAVCRFVRGSDITRFRGASGDRIEKMYHFNLTHSLIDIAYNLFMRKGAALGLSGRHCELAYGIWSGEGGINIRMKDPLAKGEKNIPLAQFGHNYVHSALGGFYFWPRNKSYTPNEVTEAIKRSEELHLDGMACRSGILLAYEKPEVTIKRQGKQK